jgi:mRNA interferase MazF
MKHGDIYMVNFNPTTGQEISKTRPAVIVNSDAVGKLELKVVVPLTDPAKKTYNWHVPIKSSKVNGLPKDSIADCFQIKSISKDRFERKMGKLSDEDMEEVKIGLMKVLELL